MTTAPLDEMKKTQGAAFSLEAVNLAELQRMTGISRAKLRRLKENQLHEHDGIRELVHGKVYSDIFKQIIVLAASEFEIMSKALCSAKGVKTKRIGDISETILGVFPKIIDFEVSTPFGINTPLHD